MTDIDLDIGELILDGVPPEQQAAVIAALRLEIGQAIARGATFSSSRGGAPLRVTSSPNAGPQAVARGIVQGLIKGGPA
jgi:hypothetical protein